MKSTTNLPGADSELRYWKKFVDTDRFIDNWCSPWPNPELNKYVADFITKHISIDEKILDCGSGPVSILNGLLSKYQIAATDPLGIDFRNIFDYEIYDIASPVPIAVEDMTYDQRFFIVHMRNALDHSQDPVKGIDRMMAALKPGGYLIIHGFENEGSHAGYSGMHKWDIGVYDGLLIVKDKAGHNAIIRTESVYYNTEVLEDGRRWFTWIEQKANLG